jgi:hypothetical protein
VEIYQEVIRDLLNPEASNLHVQEDPCVSKSFKNQCQTQLQIIIALDGSES